MRYPNVGYVFLTRLPDTKNHSVVAINSKYNNSPVDVGDTVNIGDLRRVMPLARFDREPDGVPVFVHKEEDILYIVKDSEDDNSFPSILNG